MENFNTYQNNWNHHLLKDFFLKKGKRRFYGKKDFYIRQHEVSRLAGWVESGIFQYLFADEEGTEHVVGYAFANEFVCDYASFVQTKESKVSIQAVSDCVVYEIALSELHGYWDSNAETLREGRVATENLYEQAYDSFLDSYCSPLVRYKKLMTRCPELKEAVPLRSIASYLGITPETVSHMRKKMRLDEKS